MNVFEAFVGGLIAYPAQIPACCEIARADMIPRGPLRTAYQTVLELHALGEHVSLPAITAHMSAEESAAVVSAARLGAADAPPSSLRDLAVSVAERYTRDRVAELARLVSYAAERGDALPDIMARVGTLTAAMDGVSDDPLPTLSDLDAALRERIQRAYDGVEEPRILTGLSALDSQIEVRPGHLIVLAGRPGMGKSAHALMWAKRSAETLGLTLFRSLEMGRDELWSRLVACEAQRPMGEVISGRVRDQEAVWQASHRMTGLPLIIDDRPATIDQVHSQCRALKGRGVRCVVIDYLQLMVAGSGDRESRVAEVSRKCKLLARELGVVVILLAQLNRQAEQREDKRPRLSDLRESGAIEQDADAVLLLYREGYYSQDPTDTTCEINIAKSRHGQPGVVCVDYIPATGRIQSASAHRRMNDEW